ncbi:MAG: hypothetical protein IAE82_19290, partial [Opitutaceae bacterium]|nr:hypothetical protein [Opitutaceae bacterium]
APPRAAAPGWASALMLTLVLLLVSAARGFAQEDNPFARPAPAGAAAPAAPSPLDTLELRSLMTMSGTTVVTLFNTADNRSIMVPLGSTVNGLTVSDYQSADDSVLVQSGGRERRVKIRKAQIVAMVAPPPVPPPQPQPAGAVVAGAPPPPPGQPGAAMGDEEVRARMERVAQEIRRRREMRREIMERQAQGQPAGQPTQ